VLDIAKEGRTKMAHDLGSGDAHGQKFAINTRSLAEDFASWCNLAVQ